MRRVLTPELLDSLPPDDPAAVASRRDLARINRVMRQAGIMASALARFPAPAQLADLGGGDGLFLLAVAKKLCRRWPGVRAVILDRQDIVTPATRAQFQQLGWSCETRAGDIFETLPMIEPAIVTANLFLHHLEDAALAQLLALAARRCQGFLACEPRRSRFALVAAHLVGLLGANAVTRHDAVASVRAGFTRQELSRLWPAQWNIAEHPVFPFSHVFTAHAAV